MDRIERFVFKLGRLRRLFKGVSGIDASLTDDRAWTTISGPGVSMGGKKPADKWGGVNSFLSWVYVCARLNAQSVAAVPLEIYVSSSEKNKQWATIRTRGPVNKLAMKELRSHKGLRPFIRKAEEIEEVTEHPLLILLKTVNPFMNGSDLMELTTLFLDLTGEAYWYILKGALGQPVEIWPIPSMYIRPVPGKSLKEYIKYYEYQRGKHHVEFSTDDIIAFSYPNPSHELRGMGIVAGICDAVYTNSQMYEYEESLFEKKARVGGILQTDAVVSGPEVDRMREDWNQRYAGSEKAGETPILPPGVKYIRDALTNEELSFIEGRKITWREIAAGFDQPVSLWDEAGNRATVEGALYFHAKNGILPRLRKIEEKLNEKLLPMFDDTGRLFCAFENPVPEDKEYLLRKRQIDISSGVSVINEERADDGKEPVEGGDEPLVSSLLVPLSQAVAEPEPIPVQVVPGVTPTDDDSKPKPKPGQADDDADADADKLAGLIVAKVKERLGIGGKA